MVSAQRMSAYEIYGDDVGRGDGLGLGGYIAAIVIAPLFFLCIIYFKEFRYAVVQYILLLLGIGFIYLIFGKEAGIAACLIVILIIWKQGSSPTKPNDDSDKDLASYPNQLVIHKKSTAKSHAHPKLSDDAPTKQISKQIPEYQLTSKKMVKVKRLKCPSCSSNFLSNKADIKPATMVPQFLKIKCPKCGDDWVEKSL